MPIFEYKCRDCGNKFEHLSSARQSRVTCKRCSSPRVDRQLSVFAVASSSEAGKSSESGPCPCGAPRRGMCGE